MSTKLVIDGDVVAFQAAAAVQNVYIDQSDQARSFAHVGEGKAVVDNTIYWLKKGLKSDNYEVILSCPDSNFRKIIDPTYKSNRARSIRPLLLDTLKQYLRDKHGAFHKPGLEADDILSVTSCSEPDVIIVGRDKDYLGIPGKYHKLGNKSPDGSPHVTDTTLDQANRFHLAQTLAGDRVDGYFGCPGIGMTRAIALLEDPQELYPTEGLITRGPRKGEKTTKWMGRATKDLWRVVVTNYEKAGLGETDALRNARLAYLLRTQADIDNPTTAWTPDKLKEGTK